MRIKLLTMGLFASILGLFGCGEKKAAGQTSPNVPVVKRSQASFDEQWNTFQQLGFKINSQIDNSTIAALRNDKLIEERPFAILYMELGRTIQKEPWTPLTDRVWDLDMEAIEDHGDYVEIMKNLERISRGELKFDDLKDHLDLEKEMAWITFSLKGKNFRWNLKIDDDWVDPALFTKLTELTSTLGTKGRYTYLIQAARTLSLVTKPRRAKKRSSEQQALRSNG